MIFFLHETVYSLFEFLSCGDKNKINLCIIAFLNSSVQSYFNITWQYKSHISSQVFGVCFLYRIWVHNNIPATISCTTELGKIVFSQFLSVPISFLQLQESWLSQPLRHFYLFSFQFLVILSCLCFFRPLPTKHKFIFSKGCSERMQFF